MSDTAITRTTANDLRIGDLMVLDSGETAEVYGIEDLGDGVLHISATHGQTGFFPPSAPVTTVLR
jgi:hypothetical protein